MAKYTKDGQEFYYPGESVCIYGRRYMCITEKWLTDNGFHPYLELYGNGEDGLSNDGFWVHYKPIPAVAPEPQPTEEEVAERERQAQIATISNDIAVLKQQLSDSDYKVIKCAECQLLGEEAPYDLAALHAERNGIRAEINQKEGELTAIVNQ